MKCQVALYPERNFMKKSISVIFITFFISLFIFQQMAFARLDNDFWIFE